MFKTKRSLNYANVTATLALVFSMSGGALAANHYLINSTSQVNPKILKKLKGKNGKAGANGANGAIGATGPQGPQGKEGLAGKEGPGGKEGQAGKGATIPTLTWTNLTLEAGWTEYGGYGTPSYSKDVDGFVHLGGALSGGAKTGEKFATLPEGFRPSRSDVVWLRAAATNGASDPHLVDVFITSAGEMYVENGPGSNDNFVSLEGVTFYAG